MSLSSIKGFGEGDPKKEKDSGIKGSREGLDRLLNSRGSKYGSNPRKDLPSTSGWRDKETLAAKAKSKALSKRTKDGTGTPKKDWGPKTGNWMKIHPLDRE